jgi:hypothetical protein
MERWARMSVTFSHGGGAMMIPSIPDFDAAIQRLRCFMADLGHPPDELVWVFREDVSTHRRRVLVKLPLPPGNGRVARDRYERGRGLGVGVCLDVFCRLGPSYCCTCWFVRDWEESARRLCGGLKLSVSSDLPAARPVRSPLAWAVCRWLDARSGLHHFRNFLPPREGAKERTSGGRSSPGRPTRRRGGQGDRKQLRVPVQSGQANRGAGVFARRQDGVQVGDTPDRLPLARLQHVLVHVPVRAILGTWRLQINRHAGRLGQVSPPREGPGRWTTRR